MNPDQVNHVYATPFAGEARGNAALSYGTFIGFEDALLSFSDLNYNDEASLYKTLQVQQHQSRPLSS